MFSRKNKILLTILSFLALIISLVMSISAQETVKVGIIHTLTGPDAPIGQSNLDGNLLAIDIVNGEFPELAFDLAPKAGLPNLNGAKIEAVIGNAQGEPEFGAAEAERLIQQGVCAIVGAQQSGITKAGSIVAERNRTPWITGCSTSPDLTERGFRYFFRVTPTDSMFAENMMVFLTDINKKYNMNIETIAYISANSEWGLGTGAAVEKSAEKYGFKLIQNINWPVGTTDLDSEVLTLKRGNPDVVLAAILDADIMLFTKTAKNLDYNPPAFIGFGGGFFSSIDNLGDHNNEHFITRDVFSLDLVDIIPMLNKVNQLFKERYNREFSGDSIRSFTAMMCLCDAINRAGSTDREAIREALVETNIPADQLIVTWDGIKFDEKGQNILGKGIMRQIIGGIYRTVWPFEVASADVVYPMATWDEKGKIK